MSWRRMMYSLMYRFGTPRWETNITPPEVGAVIEGVAAFPVGRALDLGCGTGTNVIYLAKLGREAVGVDFSPDKLLGFRKSHSLFPHHAPRLVSWAVRSVAAPPKTPGEEQSEFMGLSKFDRL